MKGFFPEEASRLKKSTKRGGDVIGEDKKYVEIRKDAPGCKLSQERR
jgi:hypothetical protein